MCPVHQPREAHVDVKTTDGYVVRMFVIAFTKKMEARASGPEVGLPGRMLAGF